MKRFAVLILLIGFICSCKVDKKDQIPESTISEFIADSLTTKLDSIYTIGRIQGFGVAISDATGPLYTGGFGTMDLVQDKSYSENTVQNIASISKTFIGQKSGFLGSDCYHAWS